MKYCGRIGFAETVETIDDSGVRIWQEQITERTYYGDVTRNSKRYETTDRLNDNIAINNVISIVADPYLYDHFFAIRYISWMGSLWKVSNVEVQRPRLILTIGGVYNGAVEGSETPEDSGEDPGQP